MKLSFQCGRVDQAGKHNDRNFDLSLADHINPAKSKDNLYWTYNGTLDKSFQQLELEFYEQHFQQHLDEANHTYMDTRQKKRCRTIQQYYTSKNSQPEDVIIQIGNVNGHVSAEQLWECTRDYITKFNGRFGKHCVILDAALHVDEESVDAKGNIINGTPHVHLRRAWISTDKNDHEYVCQAQALYDIGYPQDDRTAQGRRSRNNKSAFTKVERQIFADVCKKKGIELDLSAEESERHLTVAEYKNKKRMEQSVDMLIDSIERIPGFDTILLDERFTSIEDTDPEEKDKVLHDLFEERVQELQKCLNAEAAMYEIERVQREAQEQYKKKYHKLKKFLQEKHPEIYKEYYKQSVRQVNKNQTI